MASRITRTGIIMPYSEDGSSTPIGLVTDDDVEYELQVEPDSDLLDFVDERVKVTGTLMSGPYGSHVIRVGSFDLDENFFEDDDYDEEEDYGEEEDYDEDEDDDY